MRPRRKLRSAFLAATLAFAFLPTLCAQRVACEVRPQSAYLGQEIRYYVQVSDASEATCELEPVEGLRLVLDDAGVTNQRRHIAIIQNRRTERTTSDYTFVYRVEPRRTGRFVIPAPRVTLPSGTVRGRPCTLSIEDPAADDRAAIELRCEPPTIVLGQDATLVVDVYLKHLPADLRAREPRARDPLGLYDQGNPFSFFDQGTAPPAVSLPWLTAPPQGLGPVDLQSWVRARQARNGFRLEGISGSYRFLEKSAMADVERPGRDGETARYRRYRFTFAVRGEVAGTYDLAPAVVEGDLVRREGSRYVWSPTFARSSPLRFEVLEPPLEGRPDTFSGAVGSFSFEMEPPTPTLVRVGDPVYVTLVIRGAGFLKGVGLDLGAQLGDRFRVERVGVTDSLPPGAERPAGFPDRPGQWRQWDFKVFPLDETIEAIGAITFSWYDPDRRAYTSESTRPVPITVRPTASGDSDVVVASGSAAARDVELVPTSALSANVTDLNLLDDQSPRPWPYVAVLLGLPVAYLGLALFARRRRRLRDDPALLRRKRAGARVKERLRAARQASGSSGAIRQAHAALRGFVADLTDRDEEALTSDDLLAWLDARDVDAVLARQVRGLCDAVEASTFGGGIDSSGGDVGSLIGGLERVVGWGRANGPGRVGDSARAEGQRGATAGSVALLWAALAASVAVGQDTQLFNRAQAAFDAQDFAQAVECYQLMLQDGYENGHVLYNLGNAHLRAGELGAAIAAYRRASLYLPGDANLEVNLRRALDARDTPLSPPEARTVVEYVLFWNPHLPFRTEARLAVLAALFAFALATVRLWSGRSMPALKWTSLLLVVTTLLLSVSAALDYRELVVKDHGVVTRDATVLRTGPGDSFDARYEQPLDEGAELEILARREGWLKVIAGGEYEGWLPQDAAAPW